MVEGKVRGGRREREGEGEKGRVREEGEKGRIRRRARAEICDRKYEVFIYIKAV
jgi:hypothetical protein